MARWGAAALAPAAAIFCIRALLLAAGREPATVPGLGPVTAASGVLSLVGLMLLVGAQRLPAVAGATCVVVGHFVLGGSDLGAGLVYLGTGLLVAMVAPHAAAAGALALAGALLRTGTDIGHAMVALGAGWLAIQLVQVARTDMDTRQ